MIDRFKEVAKCGLSRVGRWAARTASVHSVPQSHGTLRRLEAAVARCALSLDGRWRIERTASVHNESKTRRVARASVWSARCSSSQERRAPSPGPAAAPPEQRRDGRRSAGTIGSSSELSAHFDDARENQFVESSPRCSEAEPTLMALRLYGERASSVVHQCMQ